MRNKAIHELGNDLTENECAVIYNFLQSKDPKGLKELEFNSLKNDLVIVLMKQEKKESRLYKELISMFKDMSYGEIWRDYCIQFMGRCYPFADRNEKRELAAAMKEAVNGRNKALAATALLAMCKNKEDESIDVKMIKDVAFDFAGATDVPPFVKVTAIQVGAQAGDRRILELARKNLTEANDVQLKMSSMAAIAMLGQKSDEARIAKYVNSSDVRLRAAAVAALKSLSLKQ